MLVLLWPWVLRKDRIGGLRDLAGGVLPDQTRGRSHSAPGPRGSTPPSLQALRLSPQPPPPAVTSSAPSHRARTGDAIRLSAISPQVVIEVV